MENKENKFKVGDVIKSASYFDRGVVVVEITSPETVMIDDALIETMGWNTRNCELVTDGIECLRAYTNVLAQLARGTRGIRHVIDIIEERAYAILDELAQ